MTPPLAEPRDGAPVEAVRLTGVTKRFGTTVAVDELDLTIPAGSITALLGPSGCGKTTALRLLAGFERPDAGTIAVHDEAVAGPGIHVTPERRRIGMVFQDYALFPHLDVARNVAYGLHRLPRAQRRERVEEVLRLVGLAGHAHRLPADLSGGQQQRVALARALAPQPEVILLDEPFSNLDAALRASVCDDVQRILRAADATALVVTHDQEEALSVADRVAVMHHGRILQVDTPRGLYEQPKDRFVATFVGDADVVVGRRASRFFVETALGRLATDTALTHTEVDVILRPEALRLRPSHAGVATVTSVTYFGHDQLVEVVLQDTTVLRARLGPGSRFATGDRVSIEVAGRVATFPRAADRTDVTTELDGGRHTLGSPNLG